MASALVVADDRANDGRADYLVSGDAMPESPLLPRYVQPPASRRSPSQWTSRWIQAPSTSLAPTTNANGDGRDSVAASQKGATKTLAGTRSVEIRPLSNVIVSAGQRVSVRVVAQTDALEPAILHIDRLPNRASFSRSANGQRIFFWETLASDQGEHRFRFTAIHPGDASIRETRELLVVIGDPSRGQTAPVSDGSG